MLDQVIVPAVWVGSVGIGVVMAWSVPATPSRPHPELITLFWMVGTVLVYFSRMTLKGVELGDRAGSFYISFYISLHQFTSAICGAPLKYHWREVPPADFVALKPSIWSGCLPVLILRLRQPCAFGRSIPFIPNLRQLWHVSQTRAIAQFIPEIYPGNLSRKFIPEIYPGNLSRKFIAEINARLDRLR
jgi:hypothetical protein